MKTKMMKTMVTLKKPFQDIQAAGLQLTSGIENA